MMTDGLRAFYVLFNSIKVISERWMGVIKGRVQRNPFTIEKIAATSGARTHTARSAGQRFRGSQPRWKAYMTLL